MHSLEARWKLVRSQPLLEDQVTACEVGGERVGLEGGEKGGGMSSGCKMNE